MSSIDALDQMQLGVRAGLQLLSNGFTRKTICFTRKSCILTRLAPTKYRGTFGLRVKQMVLHVKGSVNPFYA